MAWLETVLDTADSGQSHAFIATLNIHDHATYTDSHDETRVTTTFDAACRRVSQAGRLVIAYTLSRGHALYVGGRHYDAKDKTHAAIGQEFERVTGLSALGWRPADVHVPQSANSVLRTLEGFERLLYQKLAGGGISLVVENADCILPTGENAEGELTDRIVLEMLLRWGYDFIIRRNGNMVVLCAADRGRMPRALLASDSGYRIVSVPLPDVDSRRSILQELTATLDAGQVWAGGLTPEGASTLSTGLRRMDLDRLVRAAKATAGGTVSASAIQSEKRAIIEAMAHGLVEVIEPTFGFECSHAQSRARLYMQHVAKAISQDPGSPFIPKGVLFVGIPGNGKSHLAAAFAKEAGMNMLRMKNIRSMWVGESERNLETVLDLLPQLAPVTVFVDEFDQAIAARGMGGTSPQGHGADVESRMLSRLLAFMADNTYRGRILWIGATNRPDMLDVAMLRRFDRVLPFMNPMGSEIEGLLSDLLKRLGLEVDMISWKQTDAAATVSGRTCDGIEKIVRRAAELAYLDRSAQVGLQHLRAAAEDFKPNHDAQAYDLITLQTIRAVNFLSDLPWFGEPLPDDLSQNLQGVLVVRDGKVCGVDMSALDVRIHALTMGPISVGG